MGVNGGGLRVFSDIELSRRLERAEGTANANFVGEGSWIEVAGTYAMFDGPQSPCTQTFGLGLFQMPTAGDMESIEAFFRERGAPVIHEVSPLADAALLPMLSERGYRPIELTTILFLPLAGELSFGVDGAVRARAIDENEREMFARVSMKGWGAESLPSMTGAVPFVAEMDGQAIAAGSLCIHGGVGLLAGASTIPEWRNRGAQRALLEARLRYAEGAGCDIAMIGTAPGSASQRNAERQGFRIAYTRTKWALTETCG